MCGRYTLIKKDRIVEVMQNVTIKVELGAEVARWNIAPAQGVLIITNRAGPTLEKAHWGLIPHWAKDKAIGNRMINARAETLAEKPAFREALAQRRCAIPADGFYEWRKNADGTKTPMYLHLKTRDVFAFAGLWDTWRDPEGGAGGSGGSGSELTSCTIITTTPNRLVKPIHDRMPAMLVLEDIGRWLAGGLEEAEALLRPFDAEAMAAEEVGRKVNSPRNEGPELLEPERATGGLF